MMARLREPLYDQELFEDLAKQSKAFKKFIVKENQMLSEELEDSFELIFDE
eukprot:jgi/Hompol1/3765/HPOL_006786-RA